MCAGKTSAPATYCIHCRWLVRWLIGWGVGMALGLLVDVGGRTIGLRWLMIWEMDGVRPSVLI